MKIQQKAEMKQLIVECLAEGQSLSALDLHAQIFDNVKDRYLEQWDRFPNREAIRRLCNQMVKAGKLVKSKDRRPRYSLRN